MTDQRDKMNRLADAARIAAEKITDETHDEGKAAVVELQRGARGGGRKAKEATKRILKLVE